MNICFKDDTRLYKVLCTSFIRDQGGYYSVVYYCPIEIGGSIFCASGIGVTSSSEYTLQDGCLDQYVLTKFDGVDWIVLAAYTPYLDGLALAIDGAGTELDCALKSLNDSFPGVFLQSSSDTSK